MQARELRRPLGQAELDVLSEFLSTTSGAMPVSEAHGFLTAIASAPTTMMPSVWQPVLLGERGFSSMEQARHVLGLVMRLYNQIVTDLTEDNPIAPSDADEAVDSWCTGYLKAARMDDVWTSDETGVMFLFPHAVLAGEVDLVGEQDADGKVIHDPAPQLRRCREGLDDAVHEANRYWTEWRRKSMAAPVASRAPKIGRNEPCPCGSGRKFKKCCALNEH
jgi:uncharacterized protein